MATIGVHSLYGDIQKAVDYIADEDKCEQGLCEGKNVNVAMAKYDWSTNKNKSVRNTKPAYDEVTAYHFRQAFPVGTTTPDEAYEIAKEWIEAVTGGNHNYVISIHTDKPHIHAHIIVDPINNSTKKKWRIFYKRDLQTFKQISDRICLEHGKEILDDINQTIKSKTYFEYKMLKQETHKNIIKYAIDKAISLVSSYDEFKSYLLKLGFEVEDGLNNEELFKDKEFSFSINEKMFVHEKDRNDEYCIRIPYTRKYIYLKKDDCHFTSDGITCFTKINLNDEYEVYDQSEEYVVNKGTYIKDSWEEKKNERNKGRQGLRIKVPGGKKFIRCARIEGQYSLDDVIKRIDQEGQFTIDPSIKKIIEANEDELKVYKNEFYKESGLDTVDNFNKKTKQQRFFDHKVNQIQSVLDKAYLDNLEFQSVKQDLKITDDLRNYKTEIIGQLETVNSLIKEAEEKYEEMQKEILEDGNSNDDIALRKFIEQDIAPLRQKRIDLKKQAQELTQRINAVEKSLSKNKKQKEQR